MRKQTGLQLGGNRVTFKNAEVGNIADEKNLVNGDGHVIDNVRFHDVDHDLDRRGRGHPHGVPVLAGLEHHDQELAV